MATVTYSGATRRFADTESPAVNALDLRIDDGEFLVLVGPSGCGKSTSLRMLAGLEQVDSGHIHVGDDDVTDVEPKNRDIAMVFQNYALYPHMSVAENMGFALKIAKRPKEEIRRRVTDAAKLLELDKYLDRKPKALSGGQRQRVAMGRAIVREPRVFLMDEPLSNLDAKLRVETRASIAALQRRLATTTVYVTHDQTEAMTMGDRVAVLKDGLLQQCDTPHALYDRPINTFVAGFMGSPAMNLLDVSVTDAGAQLGDTTVPLTRRAREELGKHGASTVTLGVRPEHGRPASYEDAGFTMNVDLVEELGADAYIHGTVAMSGGGRPFVVRTRGGDAPKAESTIRVVPAAEHVHLFHPITGERLPV